MRRGSTEGGLRFCFAWHGYGLVYEPLAPELEGIKKALVNGERPMFVWRVITLRQCALLHGRNVTLLRQPGPS
jgi:hypothetical protein